MALGGSELLVFCKHLELALGDPVRTTCVCTAQTTTTKDEVNASRGALCPGKTGSPRMKPQRCAQLRLLVDSQLKTN